MSPIAICVCTYLGNDVVERRAACQVEEQHDDIAGGRNVVHDLAALLLVAVDADTHGAAAPATAGRPRERFDAVARAPGHAPRLKDAARGTQRAHQAGLAHAGVAKHSDARHTRLLASGLSSFSLPPCTSSWDVDAAVDGGSTTSVVSGSSSDPRAWDDRSPPPSSFLSSSTRTPTEMLPGARFRPRKSVETKAENWTETVGRPRVVRRHRRRQQERDTVLVGVLGTVGRVGRRDSRGARVGRPLFLLALAVLYESADTLWCIAEFYSAIHPDCRPTLWRCAGGDSDGFLFLKGGKAVSNRFYF